MSFPKHLRELRENAGLYQKELADKLNLSRSTITAYEEILLFFLLSDVRLCYKRMK
ncbi:MAG: helix-turn-helix transcriptional regulator [Thermoanaerobacteraceae bacterium]|nr:helix-turn-helix transcriptional regulator [Thermoanaerobacteraceae bacterium]